MRKTLADLRRDRAKTQAEIGSQAVVSKVESGAMMPGPRLLRSISSALDLPATVVAAACRESRRVALVARERSQRLVGRAGHRVGSCVKRSAQGRS
jgi:transcriptional regulator with XRE-family HTH domain